MRASDFSPKWLHSVREAVVRDSEQMRKGLATIEVRGRYGWIPLQLPSNGTEFETAEDRDMVLSWLIGDTPLPSLEAEDGG